MTRSTGPNFAVSFCLSTECQQSHLSCFGEQTLSRSMLLFLHFHNFDSRCEAINSTGHLHKLQSKLSSH